MNLIISKLAENMTELRRGPGGQQTAIVFHSNDGTIL